MAGTNTRARIKYGVTHEGGRAAPEEGAFSLSAHDQLLRTVSTCMLGENTFYEKGDDIKERIRKLSAKVSLVELAAIMLRTRTDLKLRHVPLFLAVQMAKRKSGSLGAAAIGAVIKRPDEMAEIISLWFAETARQSNAKGSTKVPKSIKRGIAAAWKTFNAYQLSKWNQTDKAVKLKDALFLAHAVPEENPCVCIKTKNTESPQRCLWGQLIDGTLPTADTWETELSAGKDKKETWERLLRERKLGYMALLMNLRNMVEAKVDRKLVTEQLVGRAKGSWALPFRYLTASKFVPEYADELGQALMRSVEGMGKLKGHTAVCIDISGSMSTALSEKSKTSRAEAGAALGVLAREICEQATVLVFGTTVAQVSNIRGLGLVEAIRRANETDLVGSGTNIKGAVDAALSLGAERIILVTDEQGHTVPEAGFKGYLMNVAPYEPALVLDKNVTRISGFSERIFDYISFEETGKVLAPEEENVEHD